MEILWRSKWLDCKLSFILSRLNIFLYIFVWGHTIHQSEEISWCYDHIGNVIKLLDNKSWCSFVAKMNIRHKVSFSIQILIFLIIDWHEQRSNKMNKFLISSLKETYTLDDFLMNFHRQIHLDSMRKFLGKFDELCLILFNLKLDCLSNLFIYYWVEVVFSF